MEYEINFTLSYGNLLELVLSKGSSWNTYVAISHKPRAGIQLGGGVNCHLIQKLQRNQKFGLHISTLPLFVYLFHSPHMAFSISKTKRQKIATVLVLVSLHHFHLRAQSFLGDHFPVAMLKIWEWTPISSALARSQFRASSLQMRWGHLVKLRLLFTVTIQKEEAEGKTSSQSYRCVWRAKPGRRVYEEWTLWFLPATCIYLFQLPYYELIE